MTAAWTQKIAVTSGRLRSICAHRNDPDGTMYVRGVTLLAPMIGVPLAVAALPGPIAWWRGEQTAEPVRLAWQR